MKIENIKKLILGAIICCVIGVRINFTLNFKTGLKYKKKKKKKGKKGRKKKSILKKKKNCLSTSVASKEDDSGWINFITIFRCFQRASADLVRVALLNSTCRQQAGRGAVGRGTNTT